MPFEIVVPVKTLIRLAPFVSNEETRYYLRGVAIEQTVAVATDGHRLGTVAHAATITGDGLPASIIVAVDAPLLKLCAQAWKKSLKGPVDSQAVVVLTGTMQSQQIRFLRQKEDTLFDAETAENLIGLAHSISGQFLIDGTYPDWRRVVPKMPPGNVATWNGYGFNPEYLGSFAIPAAIRADRYHAGRLSVHYAGEGDPAWVLTGEPDFVGVLMPMPGGKNRVAGCMPAAFAGILPDSAFQVV